MMYLKYIMLTAIILTSLYGCSQEENMGVGNSDDKVSLSLVVPGVVPNTRSELSPVDKEATINNAYFFFYDEEDVLALTLRFPSLDATGEWNNKVSLSGLRAGVSYKVHVLANVPEATEQLLTEDKISEISIDDLDALTEQLTKRQKEDGSSISFTGNHVNYEGESKLQISLVRTVAKLQVGIDMSGLTGQWKLESVKVLSEMQKTSYIGTNPIIPRVSSYNAFNVAGKDSVYYYLYENAQSATEANQVKLQINIANKTSGDTRSYTAIVNKKGGSEIIRNKIYKSKILLIEGSDPVELSLDTVAWNNKNINIEVPNTYLDLSSNIVELSSTGYADFYFKSNADSIIVKWENTNGLLVNSSKAPKLLIKPELETPGVYRLSFSVSSIVKEQTTDNLTLVAGNLTKELVVIKEASDYLFTISILPLENEPDKVYDYVDDADLEFNISTRTNSVSPWYSIRVFGPLKADGSLVDRPLLTGLEVSGGYLSNGNLPLKIIGLSRKVLFPSDINGTYEIAIKMGYGDKDNYPYFKEYKFKMEKK